MIHQRLACCQGASIGNHLRHGGTAVSVFIFPAAADCAVLVLIRYQGDAVRGLAGISEFQGTVVMVGHFVQQAGGGIVGVLNILAVLMGDLGQLIAGQNGGYRVHARRGFAVPLHFLEPVEIIVDIVDGIPIPVGELAEN